ncbi:MAG: hypothetical protein HZB71_09085 [Betaproteobacteria bacterium]|nr:hypothetical protein [Betaproteobacteria bacterium]
MTPTPLTATTLARNFSDYLNRVRYQGASYDITRGNEIIARIGPPEPVAGYPLEGLAALLAGLPTLAGDADDFVQDIHGAVAGLTTETDAWDS